MENITPSQPAEPNPDYCAKEDDVITWLLNLAMIIAAFSYFGMGQYKNSQFFGSYFSTWNPFFIFMNIPQSLAIFPKFILATLFVAWRTYRKLSVGWFIVISGLADLFILIATNDCTPDELKIILPLIFIGSLFGTAFFGHVAVTNKMKYGTWHSPKKP
jgi:hypothetical protein